MSKITLSIERRTHDELNGLGVRGETFDDILQRMIKVYKSVPKEKREKLVEVTA